MSERRPIGAPPLSQALPTDSFNRNFDALVGHPGGAHTQPAVVKDTDFYGNSTDYIVQTVKWEGGETVFLTIVGVEGHQRIILPPKVLAVVARQKDSVQTQVRRRHGKRLAAERKAAGIAPAFLKKAVGR
jgi:hypothetical protein